MVNDMDDEEQATLRAEMLEAVQNRAAYHERQLLIAAVLAAARTWNATPDDYIATRSTNDLDKAATTLGEAVDALEKFEREYQQ